MAEKFMLIVNNGSRKTGTVWIQRGLEKMFPLRKLPKQYQNPRWVNPSIQPDQFQSFLDNPSFFEGMYYSKNHFLPGAMLGDNKAKDVLSRHDVVLINSIRNPADVTLSLYKHFYRQGKTELEFEEWFWGEGVKYISQYASHHVGWHKYADPFLFSFECMKISPSSEFRKFCEFYSLTPDVELDSEFDEWMSFDNQKKILQSPHLRTGTVGEGHQILTDDMGKKIRNILSEKNFYGEFMNTLERFEIPKDTLSV